MKLVISAPAASQYLIKSNQNRRLFEMKGFAVSGIAWLFSSFLILGLIGSFGCSQSDDSPQGEAQNVETASSGQDQHDLPASSTPAEMLANADRIFRSRDYAAANELYKQAASAAKIAGELTVQVEALAQVARSYSIQGKESAGLPWLNQAAELATPSDPIGWSRFQNVKGIFQREAGDRELATETFILLYDYCREREMYLRAIDAAHMVAIAADLESQIAWAYKGIAAAEAGGHEDWLAILWNNLGWTFDDLGRYDESLTALRKAQQYHWRTGSDLMKLIADWSLGHALRMTARTDSARFVMETTLAWAERRYTADPSPTEAEWVGFVHQELGEQRLAARDIAGAISHLEVAYAKLGEAEMGDWSPDDFAALGAQIDSLKAQ
jgi:tetratricopeptide (TPR) repeat protein